MSSLISACSSGCATSSDEYGAWKSEPSYPCCVRHCCRGRGRCSPCRSTPPYWEANQYSTTRTVGNERTHSASPWMAISLTRVLASVAFSAVSTAAWNLPVCQVPSASGQGRKLGKQYAPLKEVADVVVVELDLVDDVEESHCGSGSEDEW